MNNHTFLWQKWGIEVIGKSKLDQYQIKLKHGNNIIKMIITNIITIFLFFCSIYQTKPKSLKIGNTTNDLIQTGDVTFVEDYLTDN